MNRFYAGSVRYCLVLVLSTLIGSVCAVEQKEDGASAGEASRVAVVKQLYGYFERGDMDGVLQLLSPDVVFTLHGPAHQVPWAGTYHGPAGVRQFFERITATVTLDRVTHDRFLSDGDAVHVLGHDIGRANATGGEFDAAHLHSFEVKDGKITRLEEVTDTAALINAMAPADPARGRAYFTTCAGCHGNNAEGNPGMHAPRLTLQGSDYLLRQLRHFRAQVRGGLKDFYGWQMNGRARALPDDRSLRDVLAWIDQLPDKTATASIKGNTRKGRALYQQYCTSCHGEKGMGSSELMAPRIAGVDDWYQLTQLNNYKNGIRGAHPDDVPGNSMRAAMLVLPKGKTVLEDIVSYINLLGRKK